MTSQKDMKIILEQDIRWLVADMETPISLFLKMAGPDDGILLESAEVDGRWGRYSILATDMLLRLSCKNGSLALTINDARCEPLHVHEGKPFLKGLRDVMAALDIKPASAGQPPITRALYGYFGFGMASVFNPTLQGKMPPGDAECEFGLPATVLVFDHLYNRLCQLSIGKPREIPNTVPAGGVLPAIDMGKVECMPGEGGYKNFVKNIRGRLRNGEAIQVVPSARFCIPFQGDSFTLYRRMRRFNASPYMFYLRFPDITLFGSSPEVMVSCANGSLSLSPIAGTRKRGDNDTEDAELASELLADPKDRAEHVMLVDLGRNDLGRIARPGSVRVEKLMEVEKFSHVMHLTSKVAAQLGEENGRSLDALDVIAATFPAGTVSGAPKLRAMEIIAELEKTPRGPYAGCIGWLGLGQGVNLDMGITIRSMWLKNGKLCWQAGGGIVHDSNPEAEWKEVCDKSAIMRLVLDTEDDGHVPAHR